MVRHSTVLAHLLPLLVHATNASLVRNGRNPDSGLPYQRFDGVLTRGRRSCCCCCSKSGSEDFEER